MPPQGSRYVKDELADLDESFRQLRLAYDKYFRGIERTEPVDDRDAFKKRLRALMAAPTPNTARRFRLQTLQASLVTHENYWNRITKQIEEGTFKRDRQRAEKLLAALAPSVPEENPADEPKTSNADSNKIPDAIKTLHAAYERARLAAGGSTAAVSLEAMAATIRKQAAAIKAKYQCRSVEFQVIVKDGKPILKAHPKM